MKHKQKKPKSMIHYLCILLFFGIVTGILLSYYIETDEQSFLKQYFIQLKGQDHSLFQTSCFSYLISFLIYLLLGTSVIGPFLISFLLFSKGVQAGYSSILFIHTYAYKGFLGIILTLIPQFIMDIIVLIMIASITIQLSIRIFHCCISIKQLNIHVWIHPFLNGILTILLFILLSSYIKASLLQQLALLFQRLSS